MKHRKLQKSNQKVDDADHQSSSLETSDQQPSVLWTSDGYALMYRLLDALKEPNYIRRGLWLKNRERSVGKTKIALQTELARIVLAEDAKLSKFVEARPKKYREAIKLYMS
ncbi:hypothetical protein RUND412_006655, partial [Rhizina undulata]